MHRHHTVVSHAAIRPPACPWFPARAGADTVKTAMILLPLSVAKDLVERVLSRTGLPAEERQAISEALLAAERAGRRGHGLIRLPHIVGAAARHGPTRFEILRDTGVLLLLQGDSGNGYYLAQKSTDLATDRALNHGVATVCVRGAAHCGMLSHFVHRAVARDVVLLFVCNCSPRVAPFGGVEPLFGTNPIAVGLPGDPAPLVLDMATSAVTTGDLLTARQERRRLPPGVAVDESGQPTTDPVAALKGALLPFGDHRGSGLALVVQALSTAVSGAALFPAPGEDYGYWIHAFDPGVFRPLAEFKRDVGRLLDAVRSCRPRDPAHPPRCPGDRSRRHQALSQTQGIEIEETLYHELELLANE